MIRSSALAATLLAPLFGQLSVPVAGFVSRGISDGVRPIIGSPNSFVLGAGRAVPEDTTLLSIANDLAFAVLLRPQGPELLQFVDEGQARALTGALRKPDLLSLSPSGSTLVMFSANERKLQVFTGLPFEPKVSWETDVETLPPGAQFAVAVNDPGSSVLLSVQSHSSNLLQFGSGGIEASYPTMGLAAVQFANPNQAVIADSAARDLHLLKTDSRSYELLASEVIEGPVSLTTAVASNTIIVLETSRPRLVVVNVQNREVNAVSIPVQAAGAVVLPKSHQVAVYAKSAPEIWMFDLASRAISPLTAVVAE
jgi:hypothetical protein